MHHARTAAPLAALLALLTGCGLVAEQRDEQRVEYRQPIAALELESPSGDIAVRGDAAADTVQIVRRRSWRGQEPVVEDAWDGTTLRTSVRCSNCGVSFEVHVPPSVAVTLRSGSGDVRVDGTALAARIDTGSGDVTAGGLGGDRVEARTGSGSVTLDLAQGGSARDVRVRTGSGDASVTVPGGAAWRVETRTGAGDSSVAVPQDPASTRVLEVETGSGDVAVRAG